MSVVPFLHHLYKPSCRLSSVSEYFGGFGCGSLLHDLWQSVVVEKTKAIHN